jgi:hypothetical protein
MSLPDLYPTRWREVHGVARLYPKCLVPRVKMDYRSIDPRERWGVVPGRDLVAHERGWKLCSPHLCPTQEESLIPAEAIKDLRGAPSERGMVGIEGELQPAKIGDGLIDDELPFKVKPWQWRDRGVLSGETTSEVGQMPPVCLRQPWVQPPIPVVVDRLPGKSGHDHLTNQSAYCAIVHRRIGRWIEEWRLQQGGRDFHGVGRIPIVVVGVLWTELPFGSVKRKQLKAAARCTFSNSWSSRITRPA